MTFPAVGTGAFSVICLQISVGARDPVLSGLDRALQGSASPWTQLLSASRDFPHPMGALASLAVQPQIPNQISLSREVEGKVEGMADAWQGKVPGGEAVWLDSSERKLQEGRQRQREDTRGDGFSINKTAGQILAGLWKHLHPVPEANTELLLAHYQQLVLWVQHRGGHDEPVLPWTYTTHHDSS